VENVPLSTRSDWRIALRLRQSLLNKYARWKLDGRWLVHPTAAKGSVRVCCGVVLVDGTDLRKLGLLPKLIIGHAYRRRFLAEVDQVVTF
jgi:hypothetical protein